ncbi:MAG TPA: DUF4287 domain-containing protein [Burkholderiaceae bacterium]|nr:DUF4287 domain-containing protein [Burkholderiaceae bacterium]
MPARRVVPPPPLPAGTKARGPASYFPSIEKTYGRPIQHWLDVAADLLASRPHMQAVEARLAGQGLGHGHANAVVAYVRAAPDARA